MGILNAIVPFDPRPSPCPPPPSVSLTLDESIRLVCRSVADLAQQPFVAAPVTQGR
jgi:hypothetical protein